MTVIAFAVDWAGSPMEPAPLIPLLVMVTAGSEPVPPCVKVLGAGPENEMLGRFTVKFKHQPPPIVVVSPSPVGPPSSMYRLQVPFPLYVLDVVPPKTPAALISPRIPVPADSALFVGVNVGFEPNGGPTVSLPQRGAFCGHCGEVMFVL